MSLARPLTRTRSGLGISAQGLAASAVLLGCAASNEEAASATGASSPSDALVEELRVRLEASFETLEAPGAVFGLFEGPALNERLVLELGHVDEDRSAPITRAHRFRIASVTKLFVGTVALQLLDEGRIELEDPVSSYVADVPEGDTITIADLGYHRSGLRDPIANRDFQREIEERPGRMWRTEEILEYAFVDGLSFEPGERYQYSNANTIVLGEVIASVTSQSWHESIRDRILGPMDLERTGWSPDGRLPAPAPRGYRFGKEGRPIGYGTVWFDATDWSSSWSGAAGDLYSSLDDLAPFARVVARGELLGPAGQRALTDWSVDGETSPAVGFHIFRDGDAIFGAGDVPGYSSFVAHLPERDLTLVSLASLSATREKQNVAEELAGIALDLLRGIDP
ncbi:MAG: serine hydrolase domain-containing protein [Planctomycetota bacterium]